LLFAYRYCYHGGFTLSRDTATQQLATTVRPDAIKNKTEQGASRKRRGRREKKTNLTDE
jgi:hypothetical protein